MRRNCTNEEQTYTYTNEEGETKEMYVPKADGDASELYSAGIASGINFDKYDSIEVSISGPDAAKKKIQDFDEGMRTEWEEPKAINTQDGLNCVYGGDMIPVFYDYADWCAGLIRIMWRRRRAIAYPHHFDNFNCDDLLFVAVLLFLQVYVVLVADWASFCRLCYFLSFSKFFLSPSPQPDCTTRPVRT